MARWFRVVDTSHHCGLPIVISSIVLAIITGLSQAYSLFFLPEGAAIPLIITACVVGLVGIIAALTGFRILTILYILGATLIQIPVFVVIGFVSYTLAIYNDISGCEYCRYDNNPWFSCFQSDYVRWLCRLDDGLLWSAIAVAFVACLFVGTTLQSYRKLRLHQAGVRTVVATGGQHHHHHHHDHCVEVVQQPVYTVPATAVIATPGAQPTFIVQQQNPGMYPVIPPPAYTVTTVHPVGAGAQPVNYNPARNPDY